MRGRFLLSVQTRMNVTAAPVSVTFTGVGCNTALNVFKSTDAFMVSFADVVVFLVAFHKFYIRWMAGINIYWLSCDADDHRCRENCDN